MLIPVCEPVIGERERAYVRDCLESNWISAGGKYTAAFEETFSRYCGAAHGVACSNGTAAIHLALAALGVGPDDEVIVPSFTLIVAATTVALTGARAVLVDVDPATWCLDPARLEGAITPRTRAILPVHMYGHPCDMDPILAIANRHGLAVIEDAAEAHGAEYKGRRVGAIGHIGCFSFYANKLVTTGEGGMVMTNDAALAARVRLLSNQAFEEPRFVHRFMGFNYRLSDLLAAVGLGQCEEIEEKVRRKRELATWYTELLQAAPDLTLPTEAPWARSAYWMYGVVVEEEFGATRDGVMRRLQHDGIETRAFFHPLHLQPLFVSSSDPRFPETKGEFPVSERLGARGLYLPSGLGLTYAQVKQVATALRACRGGGEWR